MHLLKCMGPPFYLNLLSHSICNFFFPFLRVTFFYYFQEQMVLRHHNEAESLNAVQKMDWEWKVSEMDENELKNTSKQMDDLHIPMVRVSDDFALSNF